MKRNVLLLLFLPFIGCSEVPFESQRDIVRHSLKDPTSAQFRNVRSGKLQNSVCGEVNAKNSYGGYVGFRKFAVEGEVAYLEPRSCSDVRIPTPEENLNMSAEELRQVGVKLDEAIECRNRLLTLLAKFQVLCN